MSDDHPGDDGWDGPVELRHGDTVVTAAATLRGTVDPVDGRYRWYGRVTADPTVTALAERLGPRGDVSLHTTEGEAVTALTDPDPWGRYRVEGRGRAPFRVLTDVPRDDSPADPP